jgi:hypothetical protein
MMREKAFQQSFQKNLITHHLGSFSIKGHNKQSPPMPFIFLILFKSGRAGGNRRSLVGQHWKRSGKGFWQEGGRR